VFYRFQGINRVCTGTWHIDGEARVFKLTDDIARIINNWKTGIEIPFVHGSGPDRDKETNVNWTSGSLLASQQCFFFNNAEYPVLEKELGGDGKTVGARVNVTWGFRIMDKKNRAFGIPTQTLVHLLK
jgi:hypothetical protein